MRRIAIAVAIVAASCSGDDAATTLPSTTATTVAVTTTAAPATTSSSSTTSSTIAATTTTSTLPQSESFSHPSFTLDRPSGWTEDPDFPATGVGFLEEHTALALPPTTFTVTLELQEEGFDLDAHIAGIQDDLAFFVPDFRVLRSGEETVDEARSLWFEYSEAFDGFPTAIREQVVLRADLLVTFTLISPVEFFEFDVENAVQVIQSFRFT